MPIDATQAEISDAMGALIDARGAILTMFAQVEWFLAKIIVEASAFDEYKTLELSFSQDAEKRAKRVRQILAIDGPLSPYADELLSAMNAVMEFADLRSFSAHAVLIHTWSADRKLLLRFRMFRMFKDGELKDGVLDVSLDEYAAAQKKLGTATKAFVGVVRRVWQALGMKNFEPSN